MTESAVFFLYPKSRQYGFDEVAESIVRALEKRHFDVPGVEIKFHTYGRGEQMVRFVQEIKSGDLMMVFGRTQGHLPGGHFNDTAAISTIGIRGEQISLYEDFSGPSYYKYVGSDWEGDREWFFGSTCFVNSKLRKEPRRYLSYKGSSSSTGRYTLAGVLQEFLVHDTDIDREYGLEEGDEPFYETSSVIQRMTEVLESFLEEIESTPERDEDFRFDDPIILAHGCPEFWTFVSGRDARRIADVRAAGESASLADRYALLPDWRLVPLTTRIEGENLKEGVGRRRIYDGYVWCSESPDTIPEKAKPSWSFAQEGIYLARISPNSANDIFVVDDAVRKQKRKELENRNPDNPRYTSEELSEIAKAFAETLTPWNDYEGDFEEPIVIIGRDVGLGELSIVKKLGDDEPSRVLKPRRLKSQDQA